MKLMTKMTVWEYQFIFATIARQPINEQTSLSDWMAAISVLNEIALKHEKNAKEANEKITDLNAQWAALEKDNKPTTKIQKDIKAIDKEFVKGSKMDQEIEIDYDTAVIINEFLSDEIKYFTARDIADEKKLTLNSLKLFHNFMSQLAPAVEEYMRIVNEWPERIPLSSKNTSEGI